MAAYKMAYAPEPRLPFFRAKCEQRGSDFTQRRDLTLLDKNQVVSLTGEVKPPFQEDGGNPYIHSSRRSCPAFKKVG
jgi:hypothetical protein